MTWIDGEAGRVPEIGVPQPLFRSEFKEHEDRQYDTRDGQTFLLNRLVADSLRDPLTLVQNWQ